VASATTSTTKTATTTRALAIALAEAAKRREAEETAEALARLGAAEELAKATEAAQLEAEREMSTAGETPPPTPLPAQAAEVHGVEEAASGQQALSGVEGQSSEAKLAEELSGEAVVEGTASTQPAVPQTSAGKAPSGLERVGEEAGVKEVAEAVKQHVAEAGRGPHVEAAVRELAHRLYSLGIDVEHSVLASYVEKFGEGAFDVVVRDVAKALAASYRVPHAASEVEELVKKYGLEQASAALKAAKEEAARGEDVREVLRRLLNQ